MATASRVRLLLVLASDFGVERSKVKKAVVQFAETASSSPVRWRVEERIEQALMPPYQVLFERIAAVPQGLPYLVQMRADLLQIVLDEVVRTTAPPPPTTTTTTAQANGNGYTNGTANSSTVQDVIGLMRRYLVEKTTGSPPASSSPPPAPVAHPSDSYAADDQRAAGPGHSIWTDDLTALVTSDTAPQLQRLDRSMSDVLRGHFVPANLVLTPIAWATSPAAVVETLPRFEAVHPIGSLAQLRMRLDRKDRACFALFHPLMPLRPLIAVHVAFRRSVPTKTDDVLSPAVPDEGTDGATVAVFYSISSAEPGLRGIGFGGLLIRLVLQHVKAHVIMNNLIIGLKLN